MQVRALYGRSLPPNAPLRVAPAVWRQHRAYLVAGTYAAEVVPLNVYQVACYVMGGGAAGSTTIGGGGGGFAFAILDVVPGQTLPTLTVAAAGGTSSVGALITATGGALSVGGTGSVAAGLRGAKTASGGAGAAAAAGGGFGCWAIIRRRRLRAAWRFAGVRAVA
jgi:hypothetical protein